MSKLVSSNGYKIKKRILEYQCGCKYSFQDYTKLEHVCFTHENELIAQCGSTWSRVVDRLHQLVLYLLRRREWDSNTLLMVADSRLAIAKITVYSTIGS